MVNNVYCTCVHYTIDTPVEYLRTPGMSAIQTVGHTIFVDRRSDQSRHAALEKIVTRAMSSLSWPKVLKADIQQ